MVSVIAASADERDSVGQTGEVGRPSALALRLGDDGAGNPIPVAISYEIIRLFSEGLYQSPHKAVEELVSNSFDAGAKNVYVVTPRTGSDAPEEQDSLWVIDDGSGMDEEGFRRLWLVAESTKKGAEPVSGRMPIGQFGIGKLAAYVLAWRLTHISCVEGRYFYASMDFHKVEGHRQNALNERPPVEVVLHEVNQAEAEALLAEVRERDGLAWRRMFGPSASPAWTAAALTDFKQLFSKFRPGILSWVLRTGLPLVMDFNIFLDGMLLKPSKEDSVVLVSHRIGGPTDDVAKKFGFETTADGLRIPGISGEITGYARLFETPLSRGKSLQYGRSNGFFIRVRGRVINLEDELFGIEALNHAAWSRFILEVDADGLRDHLLSSREGVRDSEPVYQFREYLRAKFNECRSAFDKQRKRDLVGLDIKLLLKEASPSVLADPLLAAVQQVTREVYQPSHYISVPTDFEDEESRDSWLQEFADEVSDYPFEDVRIVSVGPYDRLAWYDTETRILNINEQHPFVAKLMAHSKNQTPATMFAASEVLTDAFLRESGADPESTAELFLLRDRALRQIAGDYGPDAADVLRHLSIADQDKDALERAVGEAFIVLGFQYDRRGGNRGGADGVLDARLGRGEQTIEDFRIVYDAKTTAGSSIAVNKVHLDALWDFKLSENADFAFIIGKRFDGEENPESAVNRRTSQGREDRPMTIMKTSDLRRLVELHYRYGVTMTQIRSLFAKALTVTEVQTWIDQLEEDLTTTQPPVPLKRLLEGLERAKADKKSKPNVHAVRALDTRLRDYEPEKLITALQAVQIIVGQQWLDVNSTSGDVRMLHSAASIIAEVDRRLRDDLCLPALSDENLES